MPSLPERLRLAERALVGLAEGAELPAKIGVHPRPAGSFAHAMPAFLRGTSPDGSGDLVGMKWVAGFSDNPATGLPAIHALVVVNDPRTGVPVADPRRRPDHGPADGRRLGNGDRPLGAVAGRPGDAGRDRRGRSAGTLPRGGARAPASGRGAGDPRPRRRPGGSARSRRRPRSRHRGRRCRRPALARPWPAPTSS